MDDILFPPLATVEDLEARLDYVLDPMQRKAAESALDDASNLARHYGTSWGVNNPAPPIVKVLVLNACRRYMALIEGVVMSRAGDETIQWTDLKEHTGTVFFTPDEQRQLAALAGRDRQVVSIGMYAHTPPKYSTQENHIPSGWVPFSATDRPFPFGACSGGGEC